MKYRTQEYYNKIIRDTYSEAEALKAAVEYYMANGQEETPIIEGD